MELTDNIYRLMICRCYRPLLLSFLWFHLGHQKACLDKTQHYAPYPLNYRSITGTVKWSVGCGMVLHGQGCCILTTAFNSESTFERIRQGGSAAGWCLGTNLWDAKSFMDFSKHASWEQVQQQQMVVLRQVFFCFVSIVLLCWWLIIWHIH